ncbi:hypothetical protein D3C86_2032190 [compost metagenome]
MQRDLLRHHYLVQHLGETAAKSSFFFIGNWRFYPFDENGIAFEGEQQRLA